MKRFLDYIFKEYTPLSDTFGHDSNAVIITAIGNAEIALTFLIIGCVFLIKASTIGPLQAGRQRKILAKMLGAAMLSCGITRLFELYAIWHNYAVLYGYLRLLTGSTALMTIVYIPYVVKAVRETITINQVNTTLVNTQNKIEKIEQLSKEATERTS